MRVIYMGRKPTAAEGLRHLIQKGIDVVVVVAPPKEQPVHWKDRLSDTAEHYGIPTATDEDLYGYLKGMNKKKKYNFSLEDIDLVISMLFWKRIRKPLVELPKIGCINFHPAPLPDYRGFAPYSFGIYENRLQWGVSTHFVDETFDTGDIIKTRLFNINPLQETAFSLEQKSQEFLLELFNEVIDELLQKGMLPRIPQSEGGVKTKEDFERLRKIQPYDTAEEIERKIRAFWYPPYAGASLEINGQEYTIVNEELLEEIGKKYHK